MVIWISTINNSTLELLDYLNNDKLNISNSEIFEKKLNLIEEGLKEKVSLHDDLNVDSFVDLLKSLYKQCIKKEEDIVDLNERNDINLERITIQQTKIDNLISIRNKYEDKIKELEETVEESTNKVQELNRSLQKKKLTIDNLKQEIKSLQEVNDANEYEYNVKVCELENQIERIVNSESRLKNELERRIDSANFEKDSFHTVITKEQENGVSLLKENDALKCEIKNLNFKIKDYECKLLDLEDLAQLYEDCVEEKKHIEAELENYRKIVNDPNFQKSYFTEETNDVLYDDDDDDENKYFSDKSETLKEELEKVNKTIDEENSEIKSIKNFPSKITQDPDILNLIAERQKKYGEAAAAQAASTFTNKNNILDDSDSSSINNNNNNNNGITSKNKERDILNYYPVDQDNSNDSDEINIGNMTYNSINSGIFDDNSSFFLENDIEYKQSKATQHYLQPPTGNSLMPPPKSPKLSAFTKPLKSPKLSATSSLLPPPLKLQTKSLPIHRNRSKSESRPVGHILPKVNNLVSKINSLTTSVSSILDKIHETDLKTLNIQLRKSFDMVELANLSNKILQNILTDIEVFHKRYPLTNALPSTTGTTGTTGDNLIHRSLSLKSLHGTITSSHAKEEQPTKNSMNNDKKKYTEDSVALHNLVLTLQSVLNELCKARMLTNDYGKLYFQELENASRKEAEKFLNDQDSHKKKGLPAPKKNVKSYTLPKLMPVANSSEFNGGVSRHASLIKNKSNQQSISRGGSLKETNFLNTWADAFKNIFKDREEGVLSSDLNKGKLGEKTTTSRGSIPSTTTVTSDQQKDKVKKEKKKVEKTSTASNFMDFFKFKTNSSTPTTKSPKEDHNKKVEKGKESKSIDSTTIPTLSSSPSQNPSKGKAPEQVTEVSDSHFTITPMDGVFLPKTAGDQHISKVSKDCTIKEKKASNATLPITTSSSLPIQNIISNEHVKALDEEVAFSFNSSDISFTSSYLDPLNIPIKDPRRANLGNIILSSSPYYHYDGEEIKPFSFKEENDKQRFLSSLAREEPMLPPIDNNLR
ncbi:hypothetical protein BCR36DRAFT_585906 [Piromyces finnis]|uniref:Uncharacterized protein n=1 Tax=Piromyces finnis TaxID=1754191 RepID=A0A1Y1V182_9FUNG|nr:hypothetical protein BCR36DRAFT_585906 [Piromyces finnis]|eukprot:ORX45035.1 hypothetical protein BCR36DRAFT_585906 [Piromyces finnis]